MGQKNSSMSLHPPGYHSEPNSPFKRSSSRAAVPLDLFTQHEENQLRTASALMFAAAASSQAPANTNILVGESLVPPHLPPIARAASTRPCPSPSDQPVPKRQITSWPNHTPNLTSGEPNQWPMALTANPPFQPPGQPYPFAPYGTTVNHTGSFSHPTNAAVWNATAPANASEPLPLSGPPGYLSSPYRNATPHPLFHRPPVENPSNGPLPPPSTPLLGDAVAPAPANNHSVPTYPSTRVSPLPLVSAMFLSEQALDTALKQSGRSGMPWADWEHQILLFKLLGPNAPVHLILILLREPRRTNNESELNPVWRQLSAVSFRGTRTVAAILARWGHLVDTCKVILCFAEESGLELYSPGFQDVELFVNQVVAMWKRRVPAGESWGTGMKLKPSDVAAWTYDPKNGWLAMMYRRLRESNVPMPLMELSRPLPDLRSPPSNSQQSKGGRLTQSLSEGCSPLNPLSQMHTPIPQRPVPQGYVSAAVLGSDTGPCPLPPDVPPPRQMWPDSHQSSNPGLGHQAPPSLAAQSSIVPDNQIPENNELRPVPEGYSRIWEMMRDHRMVSGASTSVANAKAEWIHSQAIGTHAGILDRILERAQNDRDKRMNLAMMYLQNTPATSPLRSQLDTWIFRTFFTSGPLEEVYGIIARWEAQIGFTPVANIKPDGVQAAPTPPMPHLTLPDQSSQLDTAPDNQFEFKPWA